MNILLITQYYNPVKGAAAKRTGKMARFLSEEGHNVTVLTGFPSYPTGVLAEKYHGKLWMTESENNIQIKRVYELPSGTSDSSKKRLINMLTFSASAAFWALFNKPFDAVIVSSPTFLTGIAGLWASRNKKTKFFFDIRDLWPDSAIQLGLLKNDGFMAKQMEKLEKKFYNRATKIFTATPGIKDHLISENISSNKIEVLLNSVDTEKFKPTTIERGKFGFSKDDFICGYIGNHSRVYGLETVLAAAEKLKGNPKIHFVLLGEGEEKAKLKLAAKNKNLTNVHFIDEKPLSEIPEWTNLFDIGLVPLADYGVTQESFPSKTCEYMACNKGIVASIGGDMAKIIETHEVGFLYPPGDSEALSQIILDLTKNTLKTQRIGQNARKLALDMFSDKKFANTLLKTLD